MGHKKKTQRGRAQGTPNLKRKGDFLVNQYGVKFTEDDKKKLESLYASAMRKRREQLKEVAALPRMVRGKPTGDTLASKLEMGYESDFIITAKTKSLQRFQRKTDFNRYIKYLERVKSGEYLDDRTRLYKRNYMKALDDVHGKAAADIKMKVRMMKPADFRKMIEQDELLEISEIYTESDKAAAREQIRASFGMKSKDEDAFFNTEDEET